MNTRIISPKPLPIGRALPVLLGSRVLPFVLVALTMLANACSAQRPYSNKSARPRSANDDLQRIAKIYSEDAAFPSRITVSNGSLYINLNPIPYSNLISRPDHLTAPLEIIVRVQKLRSDLSASLIAKSFWAQPLDEIEKLLPKFVDLAVQSISEDEWQTKSQRYFAEVQTQMDSLDSSLKTYAMGAGLTIRRGRGPLAGYKVTFKVGPPKVRVQYMTLGSYEYCKVFHASLDDEWIVLSPNQRLIGKYHYIADWPQGGEGNFDVEFENQEIELIPGSSK